MENEEEEKKRKRAALRSTIKEEKPIPKTKVLRRDSQTEKPIEPKKVDAPAILPYRRGGPRTSTASTPLNDETVEKQSVAPLNDEPVREHSVHALAERVVEQSVPQPSPEPKKERQKKNKKTIQDKVKDQLKDVECNILISDCLNCKDLKTCKKVDGDFVKIDNALPYFLLRVLSGNAVKLYIYLCARCGGDPKKKDTFGKCWPSNSKIQEDVGISANHVHESLIELETLHLIRVHQDRVIEKGKRPKIKNRFIYVSYFKKLESIRYKKREL